MSKEARNLLDCNPVRADVSSDISIFTFNNEKSLLHKLFVRFAIEMNSVDAFFPLKNTREVAIMKAKLLFLAGQMCHDQENASEKDKFLTRKNIRELREPEGKDVFVVPDEISRPDEIGFAIAKYAMECSTLDEDVWFVDDEELAKSIDYMLTLDHNALIEMMKNRLAFKAYFMKAIEVVRCQMAEQEERGKKKLRILNELASVSVCDKFFFFPYSNLVAHLCGHFVEKKILERSLLITSMLATGPNTILDTEVVVNHDGWESEQVWLILMGIKLVCSVRSKPQGYASLRGIINSVELRQATYLVPLTELHPSLIMIRCFQCNFLTAQRKHLLRHIVRVHRKGEAAELAEKFRKIQENKN